MLAVERVRTLAQRRSVPVLSNIRIVPLRSEPWPCGCEPFYQLRYDAEGRLDVGHAMRVMVGGREHGHGCVVLLDEAGVMFNSREWMEFPPGLGTLMAQGRKLRVDVVYTSQFIDQVDKTLRELTEVAHKVRAWPAPTVLGRETGRRPLLLIVSSYRPANVDNPEKRLGRSVLLYRRKRERWYDTDELVMPLAAILASADARASRRRRRRAGEAAAEPGTAQRPAGGAVVVL